MWEGAVNRGTIGWLWVRVISKTTAFTVNDFTCTTDWKPSDHVLMTPSACNVADDSE